MKKLLVFSMVFLFPFSLHAATLVGSAPQEVAVGDTLTLSLEVAPDEKVYTALTDLSFPTKLLDFVRIEPSATWIPFTKEGYDSVDEKAGILRKTFGYPGGVATSTLLMGVVFQVVAPGEGSIIFTTESKILDENANNVLNNLSKVSFMSVAKKVSVIAPLAPVSSIQTQIAPLFENQNQDVTAISRVKTEVLHTVSAASDLNTLGRNQAAAAISSVAIPPEAYLVLLLLLFVGIAVTGLLIVLRKKHQG